jgi:hypothetical protein
MYYDIDGFLNTVKYLGREDILQTAYKKHKSLDKVSVRDKKDGAGAMQQTIQALLFWLENQTRPADISDTDFLKFRPICENLIEMKQLDQHAVEIFKTKS